MFTKNSITALGVFSAVVMMLSLGFVMSSCPLLPQTPTPTPLPFSTAALSPTAIPSATPTVTATATATATNTPGPVTLFNFPAQAGTGTAQAAIAANFTTAAYNINNLAPMANFTPVSTTKVVTITVTGTAATAYPMIMAQNAGATQVVSIFNAASTSNTATLTFVPVDTSIWSLYVVDVGQAPNAGGTYTVTVTQ